MNSVRVKSVWTLLAIISVALLASCGGGSGKATPPPPPPPPPPLTITSSSLPGSFYGEFYSANLQASGGTGARTWSISSGTLPAGLNLDHSNGVISGFMVEEATGTRTIGVTVQDAASKVDTRSFDLTLDVRAGNILTTSLPDAVIGQQYQVRLATTLPNNAISFDLTQGLPPLWLTAGSPQTLSGLAAGPTGQFTFVVQLATSGAPAQRFFTLNVVGQGSANRNEDVADARTLSNGTYFASISPLTDPPTNPVPAADNDFYRLTAQPGATVSIEITAERNGSPLDSVIELVDSTGTRLNTCNSPGQSSFANPCLDDDNEEEGTLDSKLLFRAPSGAPSTFFLHIVDWRGDGRPDLTYQFQIFGVN